MFGLFKKKKFTVHDELPIMVRQGERVMAKLDAILDDSPNLPLGKATYKITEYFVLGLFCVIYSFTRTVPHTDQKVCDAFTDIMTRHYYKFLRNATPQQVAFITIEQFVQNAIQVANVRFPVYCYLMDKGIQQSYELAEKYENNRQNESLLKDTFLLKELSEEILSKCFDSYDKNQENEAIMLVGITIQACHADNWRDWIELGYAEENVPSPI